MMVFFCGEGEGGTESGAGETAGVLVGDGGGALYCGLVAGWEEVSAVNVDCL